MTRSAIVRLVVNLLGFDIAWSASVLLAAAGRPYLGAGAALLNGVIQIGISASPARLAPVVLGGGIVGLGFDAALLASGVFSFDGSSTPTLPFLAWFGALWINFGSMLDGALRPFRSRLPLAAALGLIGGPLAYWIAATLGAITLGDRPWVSLLAFGVEWAIVTPLWVAAAGRVMANREERA